MIAGLYIAGDSPIHRMAAGPKLAVLATGSTLLFLAGGWISATLGLAATLAAYAVAGLGPRMIWRQFRGLLPILLLIGLTHALLGDWRSAFVPLLRLTAVVLAANLVTLTTRSMDITAALEHGLVPFARIIPPGKAALAISLTLRFIPVLAAIKDEIREAQRARGLERSVIALAVPLIVRSLRMTDEVAEAIEARS